METIRHSGAGYPIPRFGTAPPLMTKEEYANRRPLILKARREGQTLAAIGDRWGITGQRVRQIIIQELRSRKSKAFRCVRCGASEEALPTGMTDVLGGTHFVYHTPKGWWSITTREGMQMFCEDEKVTIVGGEVLEDVVIFNCAVCNRPAPITEAVIEVDSDLAKERYEAEGRGEHAESDWPIVAWEWNHQTCSDARVRCREYSFNANRVSNSAEALGWTLHLQETKGWMASTNWKEFVEDLGFSCDS